MVWIHRIGIGSWLSGLCFCARAEESHYKPQKRGGFDCQLIIKEWLGVQKLEILILPNTSENGIHRSPFMFPTYDCLGDVMATY